MSPAGEPCVLHIDRYWPTSLLALELSPLAFDFLPVRISNSGTVFEVWNVAVWWKTVPRIMFGLGASEVA